MTLISSKIDPVSKQASLHLHCQNIQTFMQISHPNYISNQHNHENHKKENSPFLFVVTRTCQQCTVLCDVF